MKDPMTIFREMSMLDDKEQMIKYLQNLERVPPDEEYEKPQTNADRIRAMSDEELVLFLEEFSFTGCPAPGKDCGESCRDCMMEWLKQPAEEE